jgi:serine protease Do
MNLRIATALLASMSAMPGVHAQQGTGAGAGMGQGHPRYAFGMKDVSYLGIGLEDVDSERAKSLKLKEDHGAYITSVMPDTPAAKAGLKEGDVILEFNGQRVDGQQQLTRMIRDTAAGKSVKIGLWRAGAPLTLWATVGSHKVMESEDGNWSISVTPVPPMPPAAMPPIDLPKMITVMQNPTLGIEGESLAQESQFAEFFGVKDGVLVKAVTKNGAAERAGIKAGDVIARIGDTRIGSWRDLAAALRYAQPGRSLAVMVVRGKRDTPLTVTIEEGR